MTYVKIDNGSDKRLYIENCTDVLWASTCDFCTYSFQSAHTGLSRRAGGLKFGLILHLYPYVVYASSEGSGESVPSLLENAIGTEICWYI